MYIKSYVVHEDHTDILVHGDYAVAGTFSDGYKYTRFIISVGNNGMIRWYPYRRSRTPHWRDVSDAIRHVLTNFNPEKGKVYQSETMSGYWYNLNSYRLGIMGRDGGLSTGNRGLNEIPGSILVRLLPKMEELYEKLENNYKEVMKGD